MDPIKIKIPVFCLSGPCNNLYEYDYIMDEDLIDWLVTNCVAIDPVGLSTSMSINFFEDARKVKANPQPTIVAISSVYENTSLFLIIQCDENWKPIVEYYVVTYSGGHAFAGLQTREEVKEYLIKKFDPNRVHKK